MTFEQAVEAWLRRGRLTYHTGVATYVSCLHEDTVRIENIDVTHTDGHEAENNYWSGATKVTYREFRPNSAGKITGRKKVTYGPDDALEFTRELFDASA